MNDQLPPHDADAESVVIGSVLKDPDLIGTLSRILTAEAFYLSANRTIYQAMLGLFEARKPPKEDILVGLLRDRKRLDEVGGLAYLRESQLAADTPYFVEHYAEIVNEKARSRALIDAAAALAKCGYDGGQEPESDAVIASLKGQLATFGGAETGILSRNELIEILRERTLRRWNGEDVDDATPTGVLSLDGMTGGGMRRGQLWVVAGRTSMGKSAFALHMTRTRVPSIFFSLEMPAGMALNRMICAEAKAPYAVSDSVVGDLGQRNAWLNAAERIEHWPVQIVDSEHAMTLRKIESITEKVREDMDVRVIYIDHLTELADQFRAGSDQERVGELAARCKRLAQRIGVTVVLLSQLNREAEGRSGCMPYLSDLRSSGRIEEVADVVSLLYRRSYYSNKGMVDVNPTLDFFNETGFENVQVIVAKNRNGATGTLNLGWDARPMRFVESWERSAA